MREDDLTPVDREMHRDVYAVRGMPGFSVRVLEDRVLAGRHPLTRVDVENLRRRGVTHVLDLRQEQEWRAAGRQGAAAVEEIERWGLERRHVPMEDGAPPRPEALEEAVAWIEWALAQPGTKVFVHCRGGRERTGSVLAALLAARGMSVPDALALVRTRCDAEPLLEQVLAVRAWSNARAKRPASPRHERILGCLLGGAVGDSLGAPVEFHTLAEIRRRFGPAGVTGPLEREGVLAAFTDDTQMTLFTAEGLIRAEQRWTTLGTCHPPSVVRNAYLRWLDTQGGAGGVEDAQHALSPQARGWLVDEPLLRRRAAPGATCVSGLQTGLLGSRTVRLNDSKGCGGVMRVAPVGLVATDPFGLGCDLAALTHGHPSGFLAAGAFAVAIDAVAKDALLRDAVALARDAVSGDPEGIEVVTAIDRAVAAADTLGAAPEVVESLGGGWVAEEALAIAFYCALVEPDPRRALLLAVNHSGDSDSTASMVGQLLGATYGIAGVPSEWAAAVEGRDVLERVAEDFAARFVDGSGLDETRYPAC